MNGRYGGGKSDGPIQIPGRPTGGGSVLTSNGDAKQPALNSAIKAPIQNHALYYAGKSQRGARGGSRAHRDQVAVSRDTPLPVEISQSPIVLLGYAALGATNTQILQAINGPLTDVWLWINNTTQYQLNLELDHQLLGIAAGATTQLLTKYQVAPYANFPFPPNGVFMGLALKDILSGQASDAAAHTGCNVFVYGRNG